MLDFVRLSDFSIDVAKSIICHYKFHYGVRAEVKERCVCDTNQPKQSI
jgi:hypothetical protein